LFLTLYSSSSVAFLQRNGTLPNRVKVFRGMKKSQELGRLVELNHDKVQKIWSTKKCNRFRGTDSWIFPPFINKELGFWVYSFDLCRNIHLLYVEDMTFHSVAVEKYYADLGDMSTNPAEKCYCNTPKTCLPKGIMDLTKCMGVPIYATLPHFLRVDESVQKKVKGLNPVTDDHIVRILMQPVRRYLCVSYDSTSTNFRCWVYPWKLRRECSSTYQFNLSKKLV
jgi:hypothetical protein